MHLWEDDGLKLMRDEVLEYLANNFIEISEPSQQLVLLKASCSEEKRSEAIRALEKKIPRR